MDLMEECEALIQYVAIDIGYGERIQYQNRLIDLSSPWLRVKVKDAFSKYSRISMGEALEKDLFDEIMVSDIEPRLGIEKPTFIYDYPSKRRSLARLKKDDPGIAERFELYIGGLELGNAFSELTDPQEQRLCFQLENDYRRLAGKPVYPIPEKFLAELEFMPEASGMALGIDRLVMIFLNAQTIDEVVAFTPEEL
jgi:lysyl-tRNA synthetase class 2